MVSAVPLPVQQFSMKVIGLISGGKDSFYNLMQCVANGHTVIALGNLHPAPVDNKDELDSYMYQTVGHDVIHLYKDCMELPLYRQEIRGSPVEQGSDYVKTDQDETEDLFTLLQTAKTAHPDLEAVSVGAILSNYQRIRVENVCARLGLVALAYLWQRDQEELLQEMATAGVNAVLVKIAAMGLKKQHLGQSIGDMFPYLQRMNQEFDLHICGEGGEYETITLDCPLFKKKIVVDESEVVLHSDDAFAPVMYLRFKKLHVEDKSDDEVDPDWMSDMNLNPTWEADSTTKAIEAIVLSKQTEQLDDSDDISTFDKKSSGSNDEDYNTLMDYDSGFSSHKGDILCAIGGTTAFEADSVDHECHMSIAEETVACLLNVQARLAKTGLSWTEVVFMQVFVSNMADFGVVNGAYRNFFGINPPPRACVGASLPKPLRIQVNCTAIRKEATMPKRQTLHVQGMSYWAPANIGPYSQATEQAYHGFIAGQIGMEPSTLNVPVPVSLAKETSLSLRNLAQIAAVRKGDLCHRTALCIAYVNNPSHFGPVQAAWERISNKDTPPPFLAISMPSLPKGAQVEWQVVMHHGKVYADKAVEDTGYDTDDDDMYQLEKRVLQPAVLSLSHEPPPSCEDAGALTWKAETSSWFLSPILMALSVVRIPEEPSLVSQLSTLSISIKEKDTSVIKTVKDMMAMMIQGLDRILASHVRVAAGPGVENGWEDVVAMTLYYVKSLSGHHELLGSTFETLLSAFAKDSKGHGNVAVTLVPVQAIAGGGLLALSLHAVGKTPTLPGLLQ
ncbi:diphthine-ammonia ligase [Entomortierella parvispora]|uniref:Diphthine--ammonia ligase n=1 Tax=Entomortierella parvispora TaxID=205924 RepID=A0A9P3H8V6_9FUNG|nr:diphthine-ammonia ligase [Entomortierella parvispora]